MKKLALWGASGSIGQNTLNIISQHPEEFRVVYASVHRNWKSGLDIIRRFNPETLIVTDRETYDSVKSESSAYPDCEIIFGQDEVISHSSSSDLDMVVNALVGEAGLRPTMSAVEAGIDVALANKESLVMAGEIIMERCRNNNTKILPIDSEHSAIWQCIVGEPEESISGIILTGSGGPFRTTPAEKFKKLTVSEALNHPNWSMGKKITIDSATLMNKGLEFIEAFWLYPVNVDQIEVVIHPQSIVHSLVRFLDGSVKAQLGFPDMKIPIQYALTHPRRLQLTGKPFQLESIGDLSFEDLDNDRFPAVNLARRALEEAGVVPAVLNVSNEYAVYGFLEEKIPFTSIVSLVQEAMEQAPKIENPSLDDILDAGTWARNFINEKLK